MKTKTVTIHEPKNVLPGDEIALRRTFERTGTEVTVVGKARGSWPHTYVDIGRDAGTWPLVAGELFDRYGDKLWATQEFLYATREVEIIPLPTGAGTIAWIEAFSVEIRTLSRYHDNSLKWHGVNGFIDTGSITRWQPLTSKTLKSPDPDAWIEV